MVLRYIQKFKYILFGGLISFRNEEVGFGENDGVLVLDVQIVVNIFD